MLQRYPLRVGLVACSARDKPAELHKYGTNHGHHVAAPRDIGPLVMAWLGIADEAGATAAGLGAADNELLCRRSAGVSDWRTARPSR